MIAVKGSGRQTTTQPLASCAHCPVPYPVLTVCDAARRCTQDTSSESAIQLLRLTALPQRSVHRALREHSTAAASDDQPRYARTSTHGCSAGLVGYYARRRGLEAALERFLQQNTDCQVLSLGAGFDTLFWRLKVVRPGGAGWRMNGLNTGGAAIATAVGRGGLAGGSGPQRLLLGAAAYSALVAGDSAEIGGCTGE